MESLFLSPAPQGRRVCLYAVPDGVPLYFKHNELMQQPGYQPLWRGSPGSILEHEAARMVAQIPTQHTSYRNYQQPNEPLAGFETAKESFCSAVRRLGQQLEYAPGTYPTEVLVGTVPAA
ncbi:hypothetical protein MTX78_20965 [Hymenobacter tibetensis]|uniref:Uncharacterized protein n=1 Tax=Hymenobacter tibetensis TaxID=497967 RepID=A0ABY4CWE7_9BACT|nr:hypothetical protein [Hymenobacter tibetensis]UOG74575.1 hypothetical protein MTX78_20965 [Hymenobacter tibetensis]